MLNDLFGLFNNILVGLPDEEWFLIVMASAVIFGIGCLFKMIIVRND